MYSMVISAKQQQHIQRKIKNEKQPQKHAAMKNVCMTK